MDSSDLLVDVPATPLLTIEEASRVLRIGRSLAYDRTLTGRRVFSDRVTLGPALSCSEAGFDRRM
jgi:hypothetical protein